MSADQKISAFAAGSFGLLLGFLIGLSISPVVGQIVALLTSGVLVYLGLKHEGKATEGAGEPKGKLRLSSARIASFCLACILGVTIGMYLKATNPFGRTPKQEIQSYLDAGFTTYDAQMLFIALRAGEYSKNPEHLSLNNIPTILFATAASKPVERLNPEHFDTTGAILEAYKAEGGQWSEFATFVEKFVPATNQAAALADGWKRASKKQ